MDSSKPGLDLEKELTCSVSTSSMILSCLPLESPAFRSRATQAVANRRFESDLHRASLPPSYPLGLPTYLLRRVPDRLVQLASKRSRECAYASASRDTRLHMPIMPGTGTRHEAQRHRRVAAGYDIGGAPGEDETRC